jgi:hypothetical protein
LNHQQISIHRTKIKKSTWKVWRITN